VIADLTREGVAILYVSHKLEEVFRLAERVTVLRDGRDLGTHPAAGLDTEALIALMVGRNLEAATTGGTDGSGELALEVRGLSRRHAFLDVSFNVRRGEILGIGGLVGAGRTELLEALFGLAPAASGEIRVLGQRHRIRSPRQALACGIALVSEDRKEEGLVLSMCLRENLTLASLRRCCRFGFVLDRRAEAEISRTQIRDFGIRPPDPERNMALLSGGNQQKAVIAKALLTEPDILLLDEPTRGIDVAAKAEVHGLVRRLARAGKAVVLVSSELPELLALSDRLLVMRGGRVAAELDARSSSSEEFMTYAMLDGPIEVPA
jgi:ABC-type sugar transport system ATPase subunit